MGRTRVRVRGVDCVAGHILNLSTWCVQVSLDSNGQIVQDAVNTHKPALTVTRLFVYVWVCYPVVDRLCELSVWRVTGQTRGVSTYMHHTHTTLAVHCNPVLSMCIAPRLTCDPSAASYSVPV